MKQGVNIVATSMPAIVGTWRDARFNGSKNQLDNAMVPISLNDISRIDMKDPIADKSDVLAYWLGFSINLIMEGLMRKLGEKRLKEKNDTELE